MNVRKLSNRLDKLEEKYGTNTPTLIIASTTNEIDLVVDVTTGKKESRTYTDESQLKEALEFIDEAVGSGLVLIIDNVPLDENSRPAGLWKNFLESRSNE